MYNSFYLLKEKPFQLTPDPRCLHLSKVHQTALNVLMQGILSRKGFIVVTGPIGTGKTLLLHSALKLLGDVAVSKCRIASALLVNPTLSREELLEAILDEFEVSCGSASKPRRLVALHEMLLETQRQGGTSVLMIDEAHLLTVELLEEIRLLGNTETHSEQLLQIVLSGQPEFLRLLARPQLRALQQRIAHACELRPFNLPETRAYISERLHVAGLRGLSPFSVQAVDAIYGYAKGVPRLINLLCDRCLWIGYRAQREQIQPDIVEDAAATLSLGNTVATLDTPRKSVPESSNVNTQESGSTVQISAAAAERPAVIAAQSMLDVLIQSMRQSRANARE
jgi:general secretion pathway protein A